MIIIIPARGGSKRVPNKNIYLLKGKPLLSYTIEAIADTGLNISTYVSTDDKKIAEIASSYPNVEVIIRPPEIATDTASTESVIIHVLDYLYKQNQMPEWVMTLAPTSPFRSAKTILNFIELAKKTPVDIDCLISLTENYGDFWSMKENGQLERLFKDAPRRQQDRVPLYEENSAIYLTRIKTLINTGSILGNKVCGIPISWIEGFDINNLEDIKVAEALHSINFC